MSVDDLKDEIEKIKFSISARNESPYSSNNFSEMKWFVEDKLNSIIELIDNSNMEIAK